MYVFQVLPASCMLELAEHTSVYTRSDHKPMPCHKAA